MHEKKDTNFYKDWFEDDVEEKEFLERWLAWTGYVEIEHYLVQQKMVPQIGKIQEIGS